MRLPTVRVKGVMLCLGALSVGLGPFEPAQAVTARQEKIKTEPEIDMSIFVP